MSQHYCLMSQPVNVSSEKPVRVRACVPFEGDSLVLIFHATVGSMMRGSQLNEIFRPKQYHDHNFLHTLLV